VSAEVVLNILARRRAPARSETVTPPARLALITVPVGTSARYDHLRPSPTAENARATP
jgi:hypothetical protein